MNKHAYFQQSSQQAAAVHLRNFNRFLATLLAALVLSIGGLQATAQDTAPAPEVAAVNINKADAATLAAALNGVGMSRAEDIIRYREAYGPFTTVEQLAEVKGIGPATVDKNRAVITLD